MKKVLLSALIAGSVLVACAPKASPTATNELIPATASSSHEAIAAGEIIFTNQCTKCHKAQTHYVSTHSYEQVRPTLAVMIQKAKLSKEQIAEVSAYVNSIAKQ